MPKGSRERRRVLVGSWRLGVGSLKTHQVSSTYGDGAGSLRGSMRRSTYRPLAALTAFGITALLSSMPSAQQAPPATTGTAAQGPQAVFRSRREVITVDAI